MKQGRGRTWLRRGLLGLALALAAAGTWAGFNYSSLKCRYAEHRLRTATTDDDRARWADALAAHGDDGLARLLNALAADDPALAAAAAGALERHIAACPAGDPRAVSLCGDVLDAFPRCAAPGRRAVLALLPAMQQCSGTTDPARGRPVVEAGLAMPDPADRLLAIRLAMNPALKLRADIVPLLNAPEAEVRRAALFAVGPATDDEPVIGDEELFRWLHDPDDGVRRVCRDALASRGRTDPEIALGRRLAHPDPSERLKLLLDLRYDDDVPDPEPWLERLSRDADPAVRAGAARVAVELAIERQWPVPVWVGRLADADPSPAVRQIAGFYRAQPATPNSTPPIQPANAVRPIP